MRKSTWIFIAFGAVIGFLFAVLDLQMSTWKQVVVLVLILIGTEMYANARVKEER